MAFLTNLKSKFTSSAVNDDEKSIISHSTKSAKSASSGSPAATPEPPDAYVSPESTKKAGELAQMYPWMSLLPERSIAAESPEPRSDYLNEDAEDEQSQSSTVAEKENRDSSPPAVDTRGLAPKNIDERGRVRGGCRDCDCDEFERAPKGAPCWYCHCSPGSHDLLWPPPPDQNMPPEETEEKVAEEDESTEEPEEETKSRSKFGGFVDNFRKKVKPKSTEDELEEARKEELDEIKRQMEEEIEIFEKKKRKEFEKLKEIWSELYFKGLPEERLCEDRRGVVRGRCRDCDCDGFESDMPASSSCAYCSCAPTYHVAKVDYFQDNVLEINNELYINKEGIKQWKSSAFRNWASVKKEEEEDNEETPEPSLTVYQNQLVVDALEDGTSFKSNVESIDPAEKEYNELLVKKLNDASDPKGTVDGIYPWITDEVQEKKRITNLAQLVKDNKRKGLSKRHTLILDLTEEVKVLRAEVEDVLYYDNDETLQTVLEELWVEHHKLIQRFEEYMSDLTVDSPPPTPYSSPSPICTPEHVKDERAVRKTESKFKNMFKPARVDETEADKEWNRNMKRERRRKEKEGGKAEFSWS